MSDWLKKQLERDKMNAKIENERQQVLDAKAPRLWAGIQAEFKECVDLFAADYPNSAVYESAGSNKVVIRRHDNGAVLEMTFDLATRKLSYTLNNPAGTKDDALDLCLNDRKECQFRHGDDRYETPDDISSFLLRPLFYG